MPRVSIVTTVRFAYSKTVREERLDSSTHVMILTLDCLPNTMTQYRRVKMNNSLVRFMSKVSLPTDSGCTLWTGGKVGLGYGTFWFDGKTRRAHKWIWEESNGEVPIGLVILHSCDNPSCVNLEHLSL